MKHLVIPIPILLILSSLLMGQDYLLSFSPRPLKSTPNYSEDADKAALIEHVKTRYLKNSKNIQIFTGSTTIEMSQEITGDLLVTFGDLMVKGKITGRAVVIYGDMRIMETATIEGNAVSINGKIYRERGANIEGEMVETVIRSQTTIAESEEEDSSASTFSTASKAPRPREKTVEWESRTRPKRERDYNRNYSYRFPRSRLYPAFRNTNVVEEEYVVFRYNRVEGLFLGANFPPAYDFRSGMLNFDVSGYVGYGFANEEWRYQGAAELWFFDNAQLLFGGIGYDLTDSEDEWIIPTDENSLGAVLIREDFQDYFRRKGHGFYLSQRIGVKSELTAGYFEDTYSSMLKETNWSLFGGNKRFRFNPEIDEFTSKSYKAQLTLDTRDDPEAPFRGWYVKAISQWSAERNQAFDYDRFVLDMRRYIPISRGENIDARFRIGSGNGAVPRQHLFYLGGLSTLRGFNFKEFAGDRMLLANLEYRIGSQSYRFDDHWLLDAFDLIFFVDSGLAWFAKPEERGKYTEGFDHLTWNQLHTNVGIALTDDEGRVRLNFAKSVDAGQHDLVVTFRINRAF